MPQRIIDLVILGHPCVLKNSRMVYPGGSHPIESKTARKYRVMATRQLWAAWGRRAPITGPVTVAIQSHGAWRSTSDNLPDASNLYQMPEDLLQACKILDNDRQIQHHDGSRRICMCDTCPRRPIITRGPRKGARKTNCGAVKKCPLEHVRIIITIL